MIILSPPPKVLLRRPRPKTSLGALSFVGVTPRLCAASILALFAAGTPPPVLASPDGEVCSELGERTTRPIRPTSLPVWRILALLVPLLFRRRPPLCLPPPFLPVGRAVAGAKSGWKESLKSLRADQSSRRQPSRAGRCKLLWLLSSPGATRPDLLRPGRARSGLATSRTGWTVGGPSA